MAIRQPAFLKAWQQEMLNKPVVHDGVHDVWPNNTVSRLRAMKVTYPAKQQVSVWVGTFPSEADFDRCVESSVIPTLSLPTHIDRICEVAFEQEQVSVRRLLDGFSGCETFIESAVEAADIRSIVTANSALVCYHLECSEVPDNWGGLRFLGSFSGQDVA
jgi:hypothetical protein